MADASRLEELGLGVTDTGGGLEAQLELGTPLFNPLAQRSIPAGVFALAEERLIPLEPPELVGLPPLSIAGVHSRSELEQQLAGAFQQHLTLLQRQSAELRALGVSPQVDPETLELLAHIEDPPFRFRLFGDKLGHLRVAQVSGDGSAPEPDVGVPFELSDLPNRAGLAAHLRALVGEPVAPPEPLPPEEVLPSPRASTLHYGELLAHFGADAWVPSGGAVDLVVSVRVRGERYRFAATRVGERTFRALLAGPVGKAWADQFELEDFPGVTEVAAQALGVAPEEVELLPPGEER